MPDLQNATHPPHGGVAQPDLESVAVKADGLTSRCRIGGWPTVFGDAEMTITLLDSQPHRCVIVETGNDGRHFESRV